MKAFGQIIIESILKSLILSWGTKWVDMLFTILKFYWSYNTSKKKSPNPTYIYNILNSIKLQLGVDEEKKNKFQMIQVTPIVCECDAELTSYLTI